MSDDITLGEIYRRLRAHEERSTQEHQTLHDRISRVALESVQADVHTQLERDRTKDIKGLDRRLEALEKRPGVTWGRALAAVSVAIAMVALLIQAYSTVKGVK